MKNNRLSYLHYLSGTGIEIGALNSPMPVSDQVEVKYVDIMTPEEINKHYPGSRLPDIVSDGTSFPDVADDTFNFVIGNHLLEHMDDPIGALVEWFRILKDGGIVMMAIPDKRFTFDNWRKRTKLEHVINDFDNNLDAQLSNLDHLKDWAVHVEKLEEYSPEWKLWIENQFKNGYSVHNHVWVIEDIMKIIRYLNDFLDGKFDILDYNHTPTQSNEFILILKVDKDTTYNKYINHAQLLISEKKLMLERQLLHLSRHKFLINIRNFLRKSWKFLHSGHTDNAVLKECHNVVVSEDQRLWAEKTGLGNT